MLMLTAPGALPAGQSFLSAAAESNVNQRYRIESVSVEGVEITRVSENRLPSTLRERLHALVGGRCDMEVLDRVASDLRRQLHLRDVTEHLSKGTAPDTVHVNFELVERDVAFDVSLPRLLYRSAGSFTGEAEAGVTFRQNSLTVGVVSDGDALLERYSGVSTRIDSSLQPLGLGKTRFSLLFEDYHEQWSGTTARLAAPELYRSRRNIAPELTFAPAKPLTVSVGASFEQMEGETPGPAGERSANAGTLDVRYAHKIEGYEVQQQVSGRYSLRVATRALGTTWSYARHLLSLRYEAKSGRHSAVDEVMAGTISGDAPLFERFSLGSASTLRGWDRFSVDPLGGRRMIHNEFTYGYKLTADRTIEGFYDVGSVWQPAAGALSSASGGARHSLGVGLRQGIFVLTLAVPANAGRLEAVFIAGMNY
jgi:hypothetical protein